MYRQEKPEVRLDQVWGRIRGFFRRLPIGGGGGGIGAYIILGILLISLVIWLSTGFYTVQPGEQAALRKLGRFDATRGPGLHWFWPSPIGKRNVVSVERIRRLELGFRGTTPVLSESLMITGDENIVDVQLVVQYDIKSIEEYLFRVADPEGVILKSVAETSLRQIVGKRNIDDVLTTEREAVQAETKEVLQGLLNAYRTGIQVREVKLQTVRAPSQVQDAFDDVVRAREDKERIVNLAQAYEADILPKAEGEAARVKQAAEAFKAERIAAATGQAARFLAILQEYKASPDVTRQRLYLEAMEQVLPGVTKFIVATDTGGNLLQILPLGGAATQVQPSTPPGQK